MLLDQTARLIRPGQAALSAEAIEVLELAGFTPERWEQTIKLLLARSRPVGVVFSLDRESLRKAANARGVHHVVNLNGCRTVRRQ